MRQVPVTSIPGHESLAQDNTPKEPARLVPAESYIRSFLSIFGGLSPINTQDRLRGTMDTANLFDTWEDYLGALGVPDHRTDIVRGAQTNALMVAAFDRIGIALCDRAAESDLHGPMPPAVSNRVVFEFALPATDLDRAAFAQRFDVLHRTFLGYPAALAPTDRITRFFALYQQILARHRMTTPRPTRLTPQEVAWANVCYGLVRHPEFHLY